MTPPVRQPWRGGPGGIRVLVRVSPGSAREGVEGLVETAQGGALAVRVRAVAEKGEANRAVERAVAAWLDVPKRSVAVTAGEKSRLKTILVTGEPARLAALAQARTAGLE